jgi:hypothetical protein
VNPRGCNFALPTEGIAPITPPWWPSWQHGKSKPEPCLKQKRRAFGQAGGWNKALPESFNGKLQSDEINIVVVVKLCLRYERGFHFLDCRAFLSQ